MPDGGNMKNTPANEGEENRKKVANYFSDTGTGSPENSQDHNFESFITGKPEGTGLGLSITKRILRSHNGDISVAQSSSQGTTIRIELPLA